MIRRLSRTGKLVRCASFLALASAGWLGCAGTLDPALFGAGADGGAPSGTGGTTGGNQVCDAPTMVLAPRCGVPGCHGAVAPQAGLDLFTSGLVVRLLGVAPDPDNSVACGTITEPYLAPSSNPASGLMLDKLKAAPPCGATMPQVGSLAPSDLTCLNAWATAVTTGVITQ